MKKYDRNCPSGIQNDFSQSVTQHGQIFKTQLFYTDRVIKLQLYYFWHSVD